ncbi:thioesterase family protein [Aquisalimonas lutea]|uniref:thioesterase family protein n=1 Tax=Aquisalimonas lutea TaxID=1327750 RepID=UPI0025B5D48C|nr:thioesterase family protein [Aquisalimonas lutea]MDN3516561.1 thioesterase family protein [Aquisalimonas lutea]
MATWQFDAETAVTALAPDRWQARLSAAWNIGDNPNGGYMAVPALRAAREAAGLPDPASVTIHYLRPGVAEDDAGITAELVRRGRRAANVTAGMEQQGKERLRLTAVMADLGRPGPSEVEAPALALPMPELPAPDDCPGRTELNQGIGLAIASRLDIRVARTAAGDGAGNGAEIAGWVRLADGRPVDTAALVLFADAFPPSIFSLLGPVGWVPTLELTVHVRRHPAPGWIAGRFRTSDIADGLLVEDGELWDETGALVARSRQLALLL